MNWLLEVKRTLKECKVVATGCRDYLQGRGRTLKGGHIWKKDHRNGIQAFPEKAELCPTGRWGSLVGGICYLGCQGKAPSQEGPKLKTLYEASWVAIWRASPTGLCCSVDTHEKSLPWVLAKIAKKEGSSARGHQLLQEPSIGAHKDLAEIPSLLVSTPSRTTHY